MLIWLLGSLFLSTISIYLQIITILFLEPAISKSAPQIANDHSLWHNILADTLLYWYLYLMVALMLQQWLRYSASLIYLTAWCWHFAYAGIYMPWHESHRQLCHAQPYFICREYSLDAREYLPTGKLHFSMWCHIREYLASCWYYDAVYACSIGNIYSILYQLSLCPKYFHFWWNLLPLAGGDGSFNAISILLSFLLYK